VQTTEYKHKNLTIAGVYQMSTTIEPELITTEQLAKLLSVSTKFIETHRNRIVGAVKIGRVWRYNVQLIRQRIAAGRDIVNK
jgi:hypothetical protein